MAMTPLNVLAFQLLRMNIHVREFPPRVEERQQQKVYRPRYRQFGILTLRANCLRVLELNA